MSCVLCSHSKHLDHCKTYIAGEGYCDCTGAMPGSVPHGLTVISPGLALRRMHYRETAEFLEKAKKGAGKVQPWVQREMAAARAAENEL